MYDVHRGERLKGEYCNKVYAYGAAKNLKADYRNGLRRLNFDGNPLFIPDVDPVEHTVFFDDIFPNRTATITAYTQVPKENLTDEQKQVYPNGMYKITDSTLDFDIKASALRARSHLAKA